MVMGGKYAGLSKFVKKSVVMMGDSHARTCGWRITKWADFGRFLSNSISGYKNVNKTS